MGGRRSFGGRKRRGREKTQLNENKDKKKKEGEKSYCARYWLRKAGDRNLARMEREGSWGVGVKAGKNT